MKTLDAIAWNPRLARQELKEFRLLLESKSALKEREDILPFFRGHRHLAAFLGSYNGHVNRYDRIAFELDLFGSFNVDLVVGDSRSKSFCFIEFEEATPP